MFRFEHIEYLWLLLGAIPAAALFIFFFIWRRRAIGRFGNRTLVLQLIPDFSNRRPFIKFILLLFAYVFVILGFANPQIGTKQEKIKRQGIDVMIALDISNSMMTEDVKPSRLDRAKNFISNFIDKLNNDRLGMVVFAGNAYMQMPLTVDYSAARMYLRTINPSMIPTQGTNIGAAIDLAMQGFVKGETTHKALIIITDGEDNEGGVEEKIQEAVKQGIKIFTIGIGSPNGSPIPMGNDFKRDESGNIVLSKLDEQMLRDIATKGNGKFFLLGSGNEEVDALLKDLKGISTKQFEEMVFTDFDDHFQWCLTIAALLLLIEWWLSERKSKLSLKF
ncbi:MAG TPA: VWA domain-containing protein [Chitinophagales bacterium]|nr:VWA domain-containing protein [Chitinophagales bacterium]